jgi:20S proteasome alpha/beta subunit
MEYNGSAVMAMKGKGCVAIAADRRFGMQALTLSTSFQKIFPIGAEGKVMIGLAGLGTDVQTLAENFRLQSNLYRLREGRELGVRVFASMVSSTLYEKRYVVFLWPWCDASRAIAAICVDNIMPAWRDVQFKASGDASSSSTPFGDD